MLSYHLLIYRFLPVKHSYIHSVHFIKSLSVLTFLTMSLFTFGVELWSWMHLVSKLFSFWTCFSDLFSSSSTISDRPYSLRSSRSMMFCFISTFWVSRLRIYNNRAFIIFFKISSFFLIYFSLVPKTGLLKAYFSSNLQTLWDDFFLFFYVFFLQP